MRIAGLLTRCDPSSLVLLSLTSHRISSISKRAPPLPEKTSRLFCNGKFCGVSNPLIFPVTQRAAVSEYLPWSSHGGPPIIKYTTGSHVFHAHCGSPARQSSIYFSSYFSSLRAHLFRHFRGGKNRNPLLGNLEVRRRRKAIKSVLRLPV